MALAARTTAYGLSGNTELMQLGTQLWLKKLNAAFEKKQGGGGGKCEVGGVTLARV
jgi:hypothetical protein